GTVVGVDVWEPALERARANVAAAGLDSRIELRDQDVRKLDDVDRYDLVWVPTFFFTADDLPVVLERVTRATCSGGHVVAGRYQPPPDPLARATIKLRTLRDGGGMFDAELLVATLQAAGCVDVRS